MQLSGSIAKAGPDFNLLLNINFLQIIIAAINIMVQARLQLHHDGSKRGELAVFAQK